MRHKRLQRDEEAYRRHLVAIVECSEDAIVCVDQQGRFIAWNAAAERMFGYAEEEILGQPMSVLVPPRLRDSQRGLVVRLKAGERLQGVEGIRLAKDGDEIPVSMTISALRGESGEVFGMSGIFRDITAAKRLADELRRAKDIAEAASRSKSQFLANMSHEIRTPMHGVLGLASVLMSTELTDEQREYLETIRGSGQALLAIIDDVLDLSKIEAGKLDLSHSELDVEALVRRVVVLLSAETRRKRLSLTYHIDREVPAQVLGDAARLQQVLTNLVGNAIKFTERGGVSIVVARDDGSAGAVSDMLRFEIRDTGAGITAAEQTRIFELFTQVDATPSRQHGGSGLGLAIAKRLVRLMGGEIGVDSEIERGSRFWFTARLPAAQAQSAPRETSVQEATGPMMLQPIGVGTRILVVEDNAVNQKVVCAILDRLGCEFDVAEDGQQAVTAASDVDYDIILMDCQMPGMDGFEATRRIRDTEPGDRRVPIVAMTADAMRGDRERCIESGMDDFMSKPFTTSRIAELLKRWCAR